MAKPLATAPVILPAASAVPPTVCTMKDLLRKLVLSVDPLWKIKNENVTKIKEELIDATLLRVAVLGF